MDRVRKIVVTAGIVALMSGGAVALLAQGAPGRGAGPFGPDGRRGFEAGFALGQLNLNDAQKQQVRDITQRHRQQTQPTMQRLQEAMQAERAAINQVPVNEAAVRDASAALAKVQADMAVEQARLHADVAKQRLPLLAIERYLSGNIHDVAVTERKRERARRHGAGIGRDQFHVRSPG